MSEQRILHLIDISPHIYAGSVNKRSAFEGELINTPRGWQTQIIPTGGVSFLFNKVYEFGPRDTMIFAADRTPTKRLDILPTYKSRRKFNGNSESIDVQKQLAEEILTHCGFNVLAEDGYEADDIIYTMVKKYKNVFDHIYVHTGDSDLYSLVTDNVSILPSSTRGKTVTKENFEYTVDKKYITKFNTLNLIKWAKGDNSDDIPPISDSNLRREILSIGENNLVPGEFFADPDIMRVYAERWGGEALRNFELVYPMDVPNLDENIDKLPNLMTTRAWGQVLGNSSFSTARASTTEVNKIVATFFERGLSLREE